MHKTSLMGSKTFLGSLLLWLMNSDWNSPLSASFAFFPTLRHLAARAPHITPRWLPGLGAAKSDVQLLSATIKTQSAWPQGASPTLSSKLRHKGGKTKYYLSSGSVPRLRSDGMFIQAAGIASMCIKGSIRHLSELSSHTSTVLSMEFCTSLSSQSWLHVPFPCMV